tara:strand:+ start:765 stop:866 length:102 start_codon:yes stop_codon:yes gene_type:complete
MEAMVTIMTMMTIVIPRVIVVMERRIIAVEWRG